MIVFSREKDGTINVSLSGRVKKGAELHETTKGTKVRFSVSYGKQKYMNCDARFDSDAGRYASRLENGDCVHVDGTYREWNYNGKFYNSVSVEWCGTMGDIILPKMSGNSTDASSENDADTDPSSTKADLEEIAEEEEGLPF